MAVQSLLKEPKNQEYATKLTLIGIFLTIFTVFTAKMPVRKSIKRDYQIKPFDLTLLGLATMRLGRMVAYDRVAEPIRQPFAKTVPDDYGAGMTVEARGKGVRQSLGQLISCPICAGTWIAAGLVYGLHMLPNPTRVFLAITATTGVAEMLNAITETFNWLGEATRKASGDKND